MQQSLETSVAELYQYPPGSTAPLLGFPGKMVMVAGPRHEDQGVLPLTRAVLANLAMPGWDGFPSERETFGLDSVQSERVVCAAASRTSRLSA